jgi:hypothetical protein
MKYSFDDVRFVAEKWRRKMPAREKWLPIAGPVGKYLNMAVDKGMPMLAIAALRTVRYAGENGISQLGWRVWWTDLLLVVGWLIGWGLAELDHLFYALVCDPKEVSCQRVRREIDLKRWKSAWGILEATRGERERLPVRNVLTVAVLAVTGVWLASSSASYVGWGMILGLSGRLFMEAVAEKNYQKWYWVFKREFSKLEHRLFMTMWLLTLVYQLAVVIAR